MKLDKKNSPILLFHFSFVKVRINLDKDLAHAIEIFKGRKSVLRWYSFSTSLVILKGKNISEANPLLGLPNAYYSSKNLQGDFWPNSSKIHIMLLKGSRTKQKHLVQMAIIWGRQRGRIGSGFVTRMLPMKRCKKRLKPLQYSIELANPPICYNVMLRMIRICRNYWTLDTSTLVVQSCLDWVFELVEQSHWFERTSCNKLKLVHQEIFWKQNHLRF